MIIYVDSSSLLSVYLRERAREGAVVGALDSSDFVACSPIGYVEVRSGLGRARFVDNPPRLSPAHYQDALSDLDGDWVSIYKLEITEALIAIAGALAEKHGLRAYDAVHLASATSLRNLAGEAISISTWDRQLAAAALNEGFSLAHEVTS